MVVEHWQISTAPSEVWTPTIYHLADFQLILLTPPTSRLYGNDSHDEELKWYRENIFVKPGSPPVVTQMQLD